MVGSPRPGRQAASVGFDRGYTGSACGPNNDNESTRMPTDDSHDLQLLLTSHVPLIVIETHEEPRVVAMIRNMGSRRGRPLFQWSVTEELRRHIKPATCRR
jgi:hypothetical protein